MYRIVKQKLKLRHYFTLCTYIKDNFSLCSMNDFWSLQSDSELDCSPQKTFIEKQLFFYLCVK